MSTKNQRLKIRNDFAEYPPINLSKHQMSAVMYLFTSVVEEQHRRYNDDDSSFQSAWDKASGIKSWQNRINYLEEILYEFKTYTLDANEFFSFFIKDDDLKSLSKERMERRVFKVIKDLLKLDITFSKEDENGNTDEVGSVNFFQEVRWNKKAEKISMTLSMHGHNLLFNLDKSFLQLKYSDFVPSSKYSWGIYLYMRRKLHSGTEFYTETEDLELFKNRFGLDLVKTYSKWYDLKRRVLDMVQNDISSSNDILVDFEGVKEFGSKKISKIRYKIKQIKTKEIGTSTPSTKYEPLINALSDSQKAAFNFLQSKGVYEAVILNKIIASKDLKMGEIIGYEGDFIKGLWYRFSQRVEGDNLAAIFVDWWDKGTITSKGGKNNNNNLFFETFEAFVEYKKKNLN